MWRTTLILIGCLLIVAVCLSPALTLAQQSGTPTPDETAFTHDLHMQRRHGEPPPVAVTGGTASIAAPADLPPDLLTWQRAVAMTMNYPTWNVILFDQAHPFTSPMPLAGNAFRPRLNHAANRLVFTSKPSRWWQIESMNIDGGGRVALADGGFNNIDAAWSPDDARIVFASDRAGQYDLYLMQADGSNVVRFTDHGFDEYSPAWSPDGQWIAWFRVPVDAATGAIWMMRPDGSQGHLIMDGLQYLENLQWSPDSTMLTFNYDSDGDGWTELATIRADGTQLRTIYNMWFMEEPLVSDWSTDGYLYYAAANYSNICSSSGCGYVINTSSLWRITPEGNSIEAVLADGWHYNLYYDVEPLEKGLPYSTLAPLPPISTVDINLSWSGGDVGMAGLKDFDVQVKDGDGPWTDWLIGTTLTNSLFTGTGGHTYYFRTRARDNAYNVEFWPATYDVKTTVEALPPQVEFEPLPPFARSGFKVVWQGEDIGGSGIQNYEVQYRDLSVGSWLDWIITSNSEAVFACNCVGQMYEFRIRGIDRAGNVGPWVVSSSPVTIHAWGISGLTADHAGRPVIGVTTTLTPGALGMLDNATRSIYGAYAAQNSAYDVTWQAPGYGASGTTSFDYDPAQDTQFDLYLPPLDNIVTNSHFEMSGALTGWQIGGSLAPTATTAVRYTGQQAAQLGSNDLPPYTTFEPLFLGSLPRLAVDDEQTVHLVTVADLGAGYNSLRYAARPLTGTWPIAPTRIITSNGVVSELTLTADQLGGIHVAAVWGNSTRSNVYYCHYSPAINTCGTPTKLTDYTSSKVKDVKVQLDQAGGVHLVYSTASGVFYRFLPNGGSWSPIETIAPAVSDRLLALGIDQSGTRHVLWSRNQGIWDHTAYYSQKVGSSLWQTPTIAMSGGWEVPAAEVGADGSLYLVWAGAGQLWATEKLVGQTWISTLIDNQSWYYAPFVLRIDAAGTLRAVVNRSNVNFQVVKDTNTAWRLEPQPEFFSPIVMDIDERGVVHSIRSDVMPGAISYQHTPYREELLTSALTQTLTLPANLHRPVLSFMYRAQWGNDFSHLSAWVDDGVTVTEFLSTSQLTSRWQRAALDVQPWAGQLITISVALTQPIGSPYLAAQLDAVVLGSSWTPSVSDISVSQVDAWTSVPITITGDNFVATPVVKIGTTPLTNVQWIDEHTLTALLPALPPGLPNTIFVINPGGQAAVLIKTIAVGQQAYLPLITRNYH